MVKTSSDVFCLRREQVWMYSVMGDYIYDAFCNAVFEMFILCICRGTCFETVCQGAWLYTISLCNNGNINTLKKCAHTIGTHIRKSCTWTQESVHQAQGIALVQTLL